ncbi:MAG: (4Fe-4S)-binding protein, partial [Gemmatimonadales bacterium]|nr:(4Fe-4S)-binding protein [Gemmatimonadales bacterium]
MGPRLQVYELDGLTVTFDPTRCIHSAVCVRGLPLVFNPGERRWVQLERGPADEIVEVVARCPTGALQSRRSIGPSAVAPAEPAPEVTITLADNGPLMVRGRVRIVDSDGEIVSEETRVALCR